MKLNAVLTQWKRGLKLTCLFVSLERRVPVREKTFFLHMHGYIADKVLKTTTIMIYIHCHIYNTD